MSQDFKDLNSLKLNLAKNLKNYRLNQGISQEELAFKISSARNYIGCIERGEKIPSVYVLYKIALIKNKKLDDFLS